MAGGSSYHFNSGMSIEFFPVDFAAIEEAHRKGHGIADNLLKNRLIFQHVQGSVLDGMGRDDMRDKYLSMFGHGVEAEVFVKFGSLKSLEGLPRRIIGNLDLHDIDVTGNLNFAKHFKGGCISESIQLSCIINSPLLGIVTIPNLKKILFEFPTLLPLGIDLSASLVRVNALSDILNFHLTHGRDLLACQEDLINAGLEDYAIL